MSRLIYLSSNHTSPDPLRSSWTARWDSITETGRSLGEAIDRIARHAADGRLDRLVFVCREGTPIDLGTTSDRRPKVRRPSLNIQDCDRCGAIVPTLHFTDDSLFLCDRCKKQVQDSFVPSADLAPIRRS